ncbi:DUF1559 domain-containing protein [Thalassoglobus polymorphus]|uniref:DUF1559 domain-containing protein n=1 Tax=Thalassoglobus polymorphus TaxID=2527994 RepID=A0A517QRP3_9PLAN|nr:DUF1559 domain-containing protein [Thalassoglobus polymorphus]QDT34285.1 hypothetical protein Mal48_35450 [Thalassoglobus polymorphus]
MIKLHKFKFHNLRGFTVIEFVTVISIIFLLIALLLPAIQKTRDSARSVQCKNNMKQIALALHNYHDAQATFPPGYISIMGIREKSLQNEWGWGALLLPYLDQTPLFLRINFETGVNISLSNSSDSAPAGIAFTTPNASLVATQIYSYSCPIDTIHFESKEYESLVKSRAYAYSSYSAITGVNWMDLPCATVVASLKHEDLTLTEEPCLPAEGVFYLNSRVRFKDIRDGGSQTLLIGEASLRMPRKSTIISLPFQFQQKQVKDWRLNWAGVSTPLNQEQVLTATTEGINKKSTKGFFSGLQSSHTGGAHAALADGSVRFFSENIDSSTQAPYGVLQHLSTIQSNDLADKF